MSIKQTLVYGKGGNRDLCLDLYEPASSVSARTAVILLHGGGWRQGNKEMMEVFGPELSGYGFAVLTPEYRLLGEAPWPAQIEDVKASIRWVRANADKLGIDPDKIALQGFSAGGHLSLLAAGTPGLATFAGQGGNPDEADDVAAVIAFFSPGEISLNPGNAGRVPATVLLGEGATEEDARQISPVTYFSVGYPPTFFIHGTDDGAVPHKMSQDMFNTLSALGVPTELHLYPGHTHEFARLPSMLSNIQAEIALFLRRMVVDPEKYVQENLDLNIFARGIPPISTL